MNLLYRWNLDPVCLSFGDYFEIRYYSILFLIGILLTFRHLARLQKRSTIIQLDLNTLAIYLYLGIVLGARLGHCLLYDWDYYSEHIYEIFLPWRYSEEGWVFTGYLGLASHGGVIGVIVSIGIYAKRYKVSFIRILDFISLGGPLLATFIRIGNFMNSEIIGIPTKASFGIIFQQVDQIPRHPAQLYEAVCYFIFFLLLNRRSSNILQKPGRAIGISFIAIFFIRFMVEFVKENQSAFEHGWTINLGQLLSLPLIILGVVILYINRNK